MKKPPKEYQLERWTPREPETALRWDNLMPALGVDVQPAAALPASVECPLCHKTATVYPRAPDAEWFHCAGCQWSGDMLELAQQILGMDLRCTLHRLVEDGVVFSPNLLRPADILRYEQRTVPYRNNLRQLLKEARELDPQQDAQIRRLHSIVGLPSGHDLPRWMKQMAPLIGAVNHSMIYRLVRRNHPELNRRFRWFDITEAKPKWNECLFIPSWELPGRLAGFWIIGRDGDWPEHWFFQPVSLSNKIQRMEIRESGAAFFEAAQTPCRLLEDNIFVTQDPRTALALHGGWFRDHDELLPLLLTTTGRAWRPRFVWRCLPNKPLIFWTEKPEPEAFAQARSAEGLISIGPGPVGPSAHYQAVWLRSVARRALPWRQALYRLAREAPETLLRSILLELELSDDVERRDLIQGAPRSVRRVLREIIGRKSRMLVARSGGELYVDNGKCIVHQNTGEIVADFVVRLVEVEAQDRDLATCRGYFRYKGKKLPIEATYRELEHHLHEDIFEAAVTAGLGAPRLGPQMKNGLLSLAIKFGGMRLKQTAEAKAAASARRRGPGGDGTGAVPVETPQQTTAQERDCDVVESEERCGQNQDREEREGHCDGEGGGPGGHQRQEDRRGGQPGLEPDERPDGQQGQDQQDVGADGSGPDGAAARQPTAGGDAVLPHQ